MKKKNIITLICFALFALLSSYMTYMAFQAVLTAISKEGKVILVFLGPLFMLFEVVGMFIILYHHLFRKEKNGKHFYFSNGIYLLVSGGLASIFMLINVITYKNWIYGGPTLLYPIDFLLMSLLGLAYGFCLLFEYKKNKTKVDIVEDKVIVKIGKSIYMFLALDRIGCSIMMLINGTVNTFGCLIPLYLLSLVPVAYLVYLHIRDQITNKGRIIYLSVILLVTIIADAYQIVMFCGPLSNGFMKLLSPFYGLDRISSIPLSFFFVLLVILIPSLYSLIKILSKRSRNIEG